MATDLSRQKLERSLSSEINKARTLYVLYGEAISANEEVLLLLNDYREAIRRSSDLMRRMGVTETCTACAMEGPGSCCFYGIEEGYDETLLLINLLLGCQLPDVREIAGSCYFVGENGCKLSARYYFCGQYLCPDLKRILGEAHTKDLLVAIGDETFTGWLLEQSIRRCLKSERLKSRP